MKRWMLGLVMAGLVIWTPNGQAARSDHGGRTAPKLVEVPDSDYGQPLRVDVWVDGGSEAVFYPGETVTLRFRVNRDAHVLLYDIDTRGQVHRLFPRSRSNEDFVEGGVIYTIPEYRAGYRLVAGGPPGEEFVTAVASDRPLAQRWEWAGYRTVGGLALDRMGPTSFPTWSIQGNPLRESERIYTRLVEEPGDDRGRGRRDPGDRRTRVRVARDVVSFTIGDPRECAWR